MSNTLLKNTCLALLVSLLHYAPVFSNGLLTPTNCLVVSPDDYKDILQSLTDHINGVAVLSDAELAANHDLLLQNIGEALTTDSESVAKSFELIALFDATYQPIFISNNTKNGFNKQYASDGLNLHRNIALIHQGLIDFAYNDATWLENNPSLLENKFFQTSHYFPGFVDVPADPNVVENATVKCSYMLAGGSQPWANIGNENVVRPTGCYLAPGSIAEVTVPPSLLGKGIKIRVGAHYWDLKDKGNYKRFDRVSIVYDVNGTITKIANPLGGGIYVEIPLGVDEGLVDISLKNVVRSPFYSKKTFHETSLTEWQNVERHHPAPWADFESDKFMMQVPTSWIYNFDDPQTLMEEWDKSMDVVSDLLGRPKVADRHKNYLQFDVLIRGSAYFPGYPMSNTPYNPNAATNGVPTHPIMLGPAYGHDTHFHELGHEVAISKFAGETEAIVNLLYVPVLNKCYDIPLDSAFYLSFADYWPYLPSTRDNITRTRLIADTFHEGLPRNTCGCTLNEVRYQHRGYAHYVDVAEMFGWEALEAFWKSESDAADAGMPFPVNDQPQDDRIFRMSQAAGVNLAPLFHFWGIHPNDPAALAQKMADNNIPLSDEIKCRLHGYRQLIPADYDAFVAFSQELYPNFLNYSGNNFDYGEGWFFVTAQTYDEAKANKIDQALSNILTEYYGNDGAVSALNATCSGITIDNNAGIAAYAGFNDIFCGSVTFAPSVSFGNFSPNEMTSVSIELYVNGALTQSMDWTGSLNTLEYATLTFNDITITETSALEFRITSVNGVVDGDASDNSLVVEIAEVPIASSHDLTLEIGTDNYPAETSWDFRDDAGNILAQGGGYTVANFLHIEAVNLPDDGCYTFNIYDSYGDGICCGYGQGHYRLLDPDGFILFEGGEFNDEYQEFFGVETETIPTANFNAVATEGCVPFTVMFMNASSDNAESFEWSFPGGDPATSTDENPTVTYSTPGVFDVLLTVANSAGSDTFEQTGWINVGDVPTPGFTADVMGDVTTFTNTSTNATTFEWDFGDMNTSNEASPTHTYSEAGTYEVTLTAKNDCGISAITSTVVIMPNHVGEILGISEFSIFPNPNTGRFTLVLEGQGLPELDVTFTNALGQVLLNQSIDFHTGTLRKEFAFDELSGGTYTIQLRSGDRVLYRKMVVE